MGVQNNPLILAYSPQNTFWADKVAYHGRVDSLRDNWPELKGAVGCIDGTSHRINRPTENQGLFYSGNRHMHCIHTQVIIDNCKRIRYIKFGFLGHNNDATTYHLMDPIGPAEEHKFLRTVFC